MAAKSFSQRAPRRGSAPRKGIFGRRNFAQGKASRRCRRFPESASARGALPRKRRNFARKSAGPQRVLSGKRFGRRGALLKALFWPPKLCAQKRRAVAGAFRRAFRLGARPQTAQVKWHLGGGRPAAKLRAIWFLRRNAFSPKQFLHRAMFLQSFLCELFKLLFNLRKTRFENAFF